MVNRSVSALVPTSAFVLLWSSGAIVSDVGLRHGSPHALLILRYALALVVLIVYAIWRDKLLPDRGRRARVALTGFLIAGLYSTCYLLALDHGVTPGALATLLGVQPILTIFLTERRASLRRFIGLVLSLVGLVLVVWDGMLSPGFDVLGLIFAALSLLGITVGSLLQKAETQAPWMVLPMQYAVGLAVAVATLPFGDFRASWDTGFVFPVLWLGLVISVGTTFLLYHLIASGNLVNVTSLLYLVPGVTAAMDWIILGNPMSSLAVAGLGLIVAGLALVLHQPRT